ncbi:hypothetical protein [Kaistia sp. UC242_56]|uniref:hypothetical protein n=1 Tax=Kaistia sp. UC242_56 TaxID=3374625 RepID=UPI00379A35DA
MRWNTKVVSALLATAILAAEYACISFIMWDWGWLFSEPERRLMFVWMTALAIYFGWLFVWLPGDRAKAAGIPVREG